jgi:hypothetical protein
MPITHEGDLPEDDPIFSGGVHFVFKSPQPESTEPGSRKVRRRVAENWYSLDGNHLLLNVDLEEETDLEPGLYEIELPFEGKLALLRRTIY